jgi:cysteine synthase B
MMAKLEWYNAFGSLKDRAALWMVTDAEEKGLLKKDETVIIEPTSGNTGIALSGIAKLMGYEVQIIIPEKVSDETKNILREFGAQILETEDDLCPRVGVGTDQSIALAQAIIKGNPKKYFMPNQYENEANFKAHYETTGPEIWRQTNGKITHFIAGIGTGGTITGVGTYLKEKNPDIKVYGVQPQKNHHIQGLRNLEESLMPELMKRREEICDEWITVGDEEAFGMVKMAASKNHLLVGPSSGAVLAAASEVAVKVNDGVCVMVFGDDGRKFRSLYQQFGVLEPKQFEELQTVTVQSPLA